MAAVLTTASTITCAHGTFVQRTGTYKLTVGGDPVLLSGGITSAPGCPDTNTPCTTPATLSGGTSAKLTVGDPAVPVLLDSVTVQFAAGKAKTVAAGHEKLTVG